jgi:hypothetical protein
MHRLSETKKGVAAPPSGCLHPGGTGSGASALDVAIPVARLSKFEGQAKNAKNAEIRKTLEKQASDRCPRSLQ